MLTGDNELVSPADNVSSDKPASLVDCSSSNEFCSSTGCASTDAVSYTHLDVYKRQGVDRAIQPLLEDKSKWKYDFDRAKFTWDTYQGTLGLGHKIITGSNSYIHSTAAFSGIRNDMLMEAAHEDLTLYLSLIHILFIFCLEKFIKL